MVKGANFQGLRDVDSPVSLARRYSQSGADELQIVRVFAAQLVSFLIVLALYRRKNKNSSLTQNNI